MTSVCIESTLDWSKMTFIDWTLFEMVDEQPSFHPSNLWPSVYIASNAKKKCKLIKKHLGRGNFVLFSNEENILFFVSLNKIHVTKYMQRYILCFILTLFPLFFFHLSPNRTWNFVTKIFGYRSFPIITGHGTENMLLMKFEILGLVKSISRGCL